MKNTYSKGRNQGQSKSRRKRQLGSFKPQTMTFQIDHLDPMGQGVHRDEKNVTFIAGTLPGETGTALIYKRSKGVQFARVQSVDHSADNRIEPECPHFQQCPGCQYLHTDYDSEKSYKHEALARHLNRLDIEKASIEIVAAPQRLAYRNRVQLHYRHRYIGMLDGVDNQVVEIPHCKILDVKLQGNFDRFYSDKSWSEEHSGHGHCEIYDKDGEVSVRWNEDYAHGGFSQVNNAMNLELQHRVQLLLDSLSIKGKINGEVKGAIKKPIKNILDLFSGRGNLSNSFSESGGDRVLVDAYWNAEAPVIPQPGNFMQLDLYGDEALQRFIRRFSQYQFDLLLVDPPRRGFPHLNNWVKKIKPKYLLYISCNPSSLARDIQSLGGQYSIVETQLLDLFPATAHFETLMLLKFK